jgi:putative CocE/NonD family hydrolase
MRERGGTELARNNQKVMIGPWGHSVPTSSRMGELDFGPDAYVQMMEYEDRWYRHWLKGEDTGFLDEPPISLFIMGENVWRGEHEWPLQRTVFTDCFLHSGGNANSLYGDGTLSFEAPSEEPEDRFDYDPENPVWTFGGVNSLDSLSYKAKEPLLTGPYDQRALERRDDVLCYTTAPLEEDLEVTGPLEVILYAASSARDTDFTAKLIDVHPDGRAFNLSEGILRARYRNSRTREELLTPGEVEEYRIQLAPTSNLFKKGHAIRLDISSSNFPRFNRNLNTGEDIATGTRMEIAHQTILHRTDYPSRIVLPVIPR